ncbi:MAG: helix-hairpin-helix domain-containing protein, partial [Phycisphaerae bacterium]
LREDGTTPFAGSPDYVYARYRFMFRRSLIAGFTLEKDAGESLNRGPDFWSGHLFYRDKGLVRAVALGDYQAQFGQGLTLWNGLGFGKSPFVLNIKKNAAGLRPYTSVNESLFMRGAAATFGYRNFELTTMYSRKLLSASQLASADSLVTDDGLAVSSINISGLHRTASELANRNSLTEEIIAGNLRFSKGTFAAGATVSRLHYSSPQLPRDDFYRLFRFSGSELINMGLDYQKIWRNISFFGEFARSDNGGMAAINGAVAALHPRISVSVLHRHIGKDYQVMYANAFV